MKLGATGNFPDGSLGPHDEGELRMAISDKDSRGLIHFNFGKSVEWFALPAADAVTLARMILRKAGAKKVEIEL